VPRSRSLIRAPSATTTASPETVPAPVVTARLRRPIARLHRPARVQRDALRRKSATSPAVNEFGCTWRSTEVRAPAPALSLTAGSTARISAARAR